MKQNKSKKVFLRKILACLVANTFVWTPILAQADINSEMADMFNSMGANTNYTQGGAYFSQSSGLYTGGSFSARWGNKNLTPVNIQLPGVSAGCGGLDFFAGAFSFANKEQFVQFVRNLGNNAAGVAFEIALDALDPLVGGAIAKIRAEVSKMNNFNMNSCQMARSALNGIAGEIGQSWQTSCEAKAVANGSATDGADAAWKCRNDKAYQVKQRLVARAEDSKDGAKGERSQIEFTGGNVTLFALEKVNATDEEKRWLLSMLGTMVAPPPNKNKTDEPPKIEYKPPLIHSANDIVDFVGVKENQPNVKIRLYRCYNPESINSISFDGYTATECAAEEVQYRSLKAQILGTLNALKNNISNGRSAYSVETVKLIENAELPVLKLALMDVTAKGGWGLSDAAVNAITLQIATKYLTGLHQIGSEVLGKYVTKSDADKQMIINALDNIAQARDRLALENADVYKRLAAQATFTQYLQNVNSSFEKAFPNINNSIGLSSVFSGSSNQ